MRRLVNTFGEARKVLFDRKRKSILRILYELFDYGIRYKDFPKYYSKHMLHRKDANNYLDYYIGKKEFYKIRSLVTDKQLVPFLENKVLFYHHFKESDIKLPTYLGFNMGKAYFSFNGIKSIHDVNEFSTFIEELISRSGSASIFIKPIDGFGGRDCLKIDANMLNTDYLAKSYNKISLSKYLFQETIIQHPDVSAIYPYSINTLRIHTCIYKSGQIGLVSTYMRFGSKGSYVEGGGLGTIYIDVDMNSGRLGPCARKNFEWGGDIYTHHPDTGYMFAGFEVPYLVDALKMAKSAAGFLPYRLVGWDIAIAEEGPILIEGNHNFGFWAAQMSDGGYKKNQAFKNFYEELTSRTR